MVFKGKREGSVITGGMESDSAGLWGITWFSRGGKGGNQSSRGGGELGLWRNHLVFKGAEGISHN